MSRRDRTPRRTGLLSRPPLKVVELPVPQWLTFEAPPLLPPMTQSVFFRTDLLTGKLEAWVRTEYEGVVTETLLRDAR